MLPIAAAVGYATGVFHLYGIGPYIGPISQSFGWSRVQTMSGLSIALLIGAALAVPTGMLVDRYGPRVFGVAGVLSMTGAFALLGTASGGPANWYVLWAILGIMSMPAQAMVWTRAVATRFDRSRGLALAVTMCGASLATGLFPLLGTWLIQTQGWRHALAWQGGVWAAIAFPFLFLFFRTGHPQQASAAQPPVPESAGMTLLEGFRSSIYVRLLVATFLTGTSVMALVVHFVPILSAFGTDSLRAAGIASLVGIAAIVGRLTTGVLLDRFRASMVGAVAFLLPMMSCVLLLAGGDRVPLQFLAAVLVGLTLGAEVDVLAYTTTKYFGLRNFGGLFGGQVTAVAIGSAIGPLVAAAIFDRYGSYTAFLGFVIVAMLASSAALASLPRPAVRA